MLQKAPGGSDKLFVHEKRWNLARSSSDGVHTPHPHSPTSRNSHLHITAPQSRFTQENERKLVLLGTEPWYLTFLNSRAHAGVPVLGASTCAPITLSFDTNPSPCRQDNKYKLQEPVLLSHAPFKCVSGLQEYPDRPSRHEIHLLPSVRSFKTPVKGNPRQKGVLTPPSRHARGQIIDETACLDDLIL